MPHWSCRAAWCCYWLRAVCWLLALPPKLKLRAAASGRQRRQARIGEPLGRRATSANSAAAAAASFRHRVRGSCVCSFAFLPCALEGLCTTM